MYRKTTGLVAAVVGLLAIFASDAAAQAPALSVTAVANSVTIQWTPLPGVTGYTIGVGTAPGASNLADVNLPAFVTRIMVKAPAATYYLRVRGFVGTLVGPNSNEASVTVADQPAPPPCAPIAAPSVVTATASGLAVNVNWTPVAGAAGYQIQWSRQPNTTELVETTTATSLAKHIGFAGTFYVRVLAASACGTTAVSQTAAFTLAGGPAPAPGWVPSPGGGRTPNPPAGQMLPVPSYGAAVVNEVARRFPAELSRSCKTNHDWLYILLNELRKRDTRWGLNWKRGDTRQGMSSDVVTYNPTDQPDEGNGKVYLFDVVGAECEQNFPTFNNVTAHTWSFAGDPMCGGGTYCVKWTLQPYLQAGFPAITSEEKK